MKSFYQGQQGFSRGLVLPLWKELKMVWCELEEFVANIEENLRQLEEEVVKQDEKENQQVS